MIPNTTSLLQILILTTGIYVVLGFLRTTRGSGLVKGLGVTLLVGVVGLWGLSKYLVLEELDHIIQGITGYVVVILAILFQPELRRGIVHLGENPLLGRLLKARRREVVTEVVQAAVGMAKKRQGALIAFERQFALDAFIERAVKVDAEVNRFLIDSIFHHGSALHDGAIIIRQDRIAAASCLFPLTENIEISKSTGTRHRAALGLTEETDAVTLTVSEETGEIALSREGKMQRRVPQSKIEAVLREALGSGEGDAKEGEGARSQAPSWLFSFFTENLPRKAASIAMAMGLFWVAHQDISATQEFTLRVIGATNETAPPTGTDGVLVVILPSDEFHLATPTPEQQLVVDITGTRAQVEGLGAAISGRLELEGTPQAGVDIDFPLEDVRWSGGSFAEELKIAWNERFPEPSMKIEQVGRPKRFQLEARHIRVDSTNENPRYRHQPEGLTFRPTTIEIEGPLGGIDLLDTADLALHFEPIVLTEEDTDDWEGGIALDADLVAQGFALVGRETVDVFLPIVPETQNLDAAFEPDIVLVDTSGRSLDAWEQITQKARFEIQTTGILTERDSESDAYASERVRLIGFVRDNLRVIVDAGRITDSPDSTSTTVPIEWVWSKDWREEFDVQGDPRAELSLELTSDPDIKLIRREP